MKVLFQALEEKIIGGDGGGNTLPTSLMACQPPQGRLFSALMP